MDRLSLSVLCLHHIKLNIYQIAYQLYFRTERNHVYLEHQEQTSVPPRLLVIDALTVSTWYREWLKCYHVNGPYVNKSRHHRPSEITENKAPQLHCRSLGGIDPMLCMYRPTVCETSLCVAGRRSMDAATGDISLTIDYLSFAFNHLVHQFVSLSGNWRRFLLLRSRMVLRVRQWVTYHVVSRHGRVLFAASRSCVQQRVA